MNDTLQISKLKGFVADLSQSKIQLDDNLQNTLTRFLEIAEFPSTRNEEYKYTRLGKIQNSKFIQAPLTSINTDHLDTIEDSIKIVFENGKIKNFSNEAVEGLKIKELIENNDSHALNSENLDVFKAINLQYSEGGIVIKVDKNRKIERIIEIIHVMSVENALSNYRLQIHVENNSEIKIVQRFISVDDQKTFSNIVLDAIIEDGAHLSIDNLQLENDKSFTVNNSLISQNGNSTFKINTITLSGALVRNNLRINVIGQNAISYLNGMYLTDGDQHVDNHTIVDHLAPNCESHEKYKGVLNDKSTGVFNGKVFVRKDSQKINAFQSNANVLLSDLATINSKPELEIYADDVKCSHGSTTGQLDDEAIFYLRARGISEQSAKQLMVSAFITDVIESIDNEFLRNQIMDLTETKLNKALS